MLRIAIISSSVREGRNSHRVALYLRNYITHNHLADTELMDLAQYRFPIFGERLRKIQNPPAAAVEFSEKIKAAQGVIIVTPEYNGGYPASLKNVVDLLLDEWYRKPVAISTVSIGAFGGAQVITSLQFSLWKLRALMVPAVLPVPLVEQSFDAEGRPAAKEKMDGKAKKFLDELLWWMEAKEEREVKGKR